MENKESKNVRLKNRRCYYFDDIIKLEDFDFDQRPIQSTSCSSNDEVKFLEENR